MRTRFIIEPKAYEMVKAGYSITAISGPISGAEGDKIALTIADPDGYIYRLDGNRKAPEASYFNYAQTLGHRTALLYDNASYYPIRHIQDGCAKRLVKVSTLKAIIKPMFEHGYFKLWDRHMFNGDPELALFAQGPYIGLADVSNRYWVRILCVADRTHWDDFDPQPTKWEYSDVDDVFAHFDGRQ